MSEPLTSSGTKRPRNSLSGFLRYKLHSWFWHKDPVLRMLARFSAVMALYCAIATVPVFDGPIHEYACANARLANAMLNLIGEKSFVSDAVLWSSRFSIMVAKGCAGLDFVAFFCSAVLAFPVSLVRKIPGVVAGCIFLPTLNLVRIMSLYFIGVHYRAWFDLFHEELWAVPLIAGTAALLVAWIGWALRYEEPVTA